MSLEEALDFIAEDEVVEVTPKISACASAPCPADERYRRDVTGPGLWQIARGSTVPASGFGGEETWPDYLKILSWAES